MMGDLLVASPYVQISDSLKITFTASMQEFCFVYVLWEMALSSWTQLHGLGADTISMENRATEHT